LDISAYLKKRGYLTVDATYRSKVDEWLDWYQGDVKDFHAYSVYNGIQKVGVRRASLQMAKCIAEDWANLLLNERVVIHASSFQNRLEELLQKNRFTVRGNQLIELAFALGTGAFVEYLSSDNEPVIDCIRADLVHPLAWDNGVVTECAFGGVRAIRQKECCYLQLHVLDENGTYSIENHLFDNETGEELSLEEYCPDLAPKVETGSETPLFQIITPNITNNFDLDCPMGVSVYANAISALRSLDLAYDSYTNEFALGRKRIMVPITMAKIQMTKDGTAQPIFDSNDVAFYAMQLPDGATQEIKDISPPIRATEHEQGIRLMLNLLSKNAASATTGINSRRAA
jgi:A118 family predicted phage portal protein